MIAYNLTEKQKSILRIIVEHLEIGSLEEPIIISSSGSECQIIGINQIFDTDLPGNLDALCDCDLMGFAYSNSGKTYMVKQAGYDAIRNDFSMPERLIPQLNIGAIIHEMRGGNVQAIGLSDQSDIKQIVNDPQLLTARLDELGNQLIDSIKMELSADKLVSYIKLVDDLKKEVASDQPSPSVLQRLLSSLAFMGDIEGAISFTLRVWPYIYPILVIATEKLLNSH